MIKSLQKMLDVRQWCHCLKGPCVTLSSLRYSYLCKKVVAAKTFVTPEKLPPTESATKHHSRRTYLQVLEWMGMSENLDHTKWGWTLQGERHMPIMMDNIPAPPTLLNIIHCNCSARCKTLGCSCRK